MDVRDKIFVNGDWVPSAGKGTIDVINSTTEEVMGTIPEGTPADVDLAVKAAVAAFPKWSTTSVEERSKALSRIAEGLTARTDEIAALISREVGMPRLSGAHRMPGRRIGQPGGVRRLGRDDRTRAPRSAAPPARCRFVARTARDGP